MSKKVIFLIIVIVIIVTIGFYRSQKSKADKSKIEVAKVSQKNLNEEISSSGKTRAQRQVNLAFQAAGRLAWVGVKEGDTVSQYQTIASLDVTEIKRNLEKALRDYSKERNDFQEDKLDTYRYHPLTDTIKRVLEKNQYDLEKSVMDVEIKDFALKLATLTTPISGIVTRVDAPLAGINITTATTYTVIDPTSLVFSANVDEIDVGRIQVGQKAELSMDAYQDQKFMGTVSKVAFAAEISSSGTTVFPVEVTFDENVKLRTGLNGDVRIIIKEIPNATVVSNDAVREKDGQKYVIKKSNNKYLKTNIKIGSETDEESEILEGLSVGDEIVVKGFQYLPKELQ